MRVLVVDDSAAQRGWLVALLEGDPEVQVPAVRRMAPKRCAWPLA